MNFSEQSERISNFIPTLGRDNITKPKKVLFLSHIYPPAVDGGSQIIHRLCRQFEDKGNQTLVVTSDGWSTDDFVSPQSKRLASVRNNLIRVRTIRRPVKVIRRIIGPVFWGFPWIKIICWRPEIVVGGVYPTTMPVYAWTAAKLTGAKLYLLPCFHRDDQAFHRWPLIPILKSADLIYALTENEKKYYQKIFNVQSSRRKLCKPGGHPNIQIFRPKIDKSLIMAENEQAPFPKTPTILYLGSQAAHKRIEMLVEAFKQVLETPKKVNLVIAGRQTLYTPVIKKMISKLPKKISCQIKILGEYDREEEIHLLDESTVLVNPSHHESLGLVFLEAWARKKPVIGADLAPLKEVIADGENGFLFKKNSVHHLSAKIKEIIDNPRLAREMGEKGYEQKKGF